MSFWVSSYEERNLEVELKIHKGSVAVYGLLMWWVSIFAKLESYDCLNWKRLGGGRNWEKIVGSWGFFHGGHEGGFHN